MLRTNISMLLKMNITEMYKMSMLGVVPLPKFHK